MEFGTMRPHDWFVVAMGISVVFIGLICIVILCKIMSAVCRLGEGKPAKETAANTPAATPAKAVAAEEIPNRAEIIAAVTAVAAEEMGADVSAIRVLSFKKL